MSTAGRVRERATKKEATRQPAMLPSSSRWSMRAKRAAQRLKMMIFTGV